MIHGKEENDVENVNNTLKERLNVGINDDSFLYKKQDHHINIQTISTESNNKLDKENNENIHKTYHNINKNNEEDEEDEEEEDQEDEEQEEQEEQEQDDEININNHNNRSNHINYNRNNKYIEDDEDRSSNTDNEDNDKTNDMMDEKQEQIQDQEQEQEVSWIVWFCSLEGNEFFCEIEEAYIQDFFNLTGLNTLIPYFDYAHDMILDLESEGEANFSMKQKERIDRAAEVLYGLIHTRYILTGKGLEKMAIKYRNGDFGRCHRYYCKGQPVLPIGLTDIPRQSSVVVFCPRCKEIYYPRARRHANLDGAYFGTTFAHFFLLTHPSYVISDDLNPKLNYIPRIFGYKINKNSEYYTGKKKNVIRKVNRSTITNGTNLMKSKN